MTAVLLLKLLTATREWAPVRFSNYPDWTWVHEELGPEARELVDPNGDWVIFVDGALLYYVTDGGEVQHFRLEELPHPKRYSGLKVGCERKDGTLNIHPVEESCDECKEEN